MTPTLVSSETVFQVTKFALSFAPVPGLEAAVTVVQKIYELAKGVEIHRAKCISLADAAVSLMETIRDNAPAAEPTKLDKAVNKALTTLEDAKQDVDRWSHYGRAKSFYYRHTIEDAIQKHGDEMEDCLQLLDVAATLQVNNIAIIIQRGREEDSLKLDDILQNQEIMMESLSELHMMIQELPAQSQERSKASNALLQLRKDEVKLGKIGALPSELKGECTKISHVWSGHRCDIWRGLRLESEVVALKFYRVFKRPGDQTKDQERFERQINLWRAMDHPNILTLHGWCYIDQDICLVTPWLRNQDMRNYLAKNSVSDEYKLQVTIEIAQGIQYLHNRGLLHGDVQPSNILIDDNGHVKLGDFTVTKALGGQILNTQSSCDLSSLRYQPPETMREEVETSAVDIYSWAMTTLVVASGVQPFPKHTSVPKLLMLLAKVESPVAADYTSTLFTTYPRLWPLLERCWEREPTSRPPVQDVLESLSLVKGQ